MGGGVHPRRFIPGGTGKLTIQRRPFPKGGDGARVKARVVFESLGGKFNEDFYRATYSDVDSAVRGGQFPTGYAHFIEHGITEGRNGMWTGASGEFDEASYLSGYMDVAKMVADGKYRCGAHHFWEVGRKEGRQGFAVPVVADDTPPPVKNTPEPVDAITVDVPFTESYNANTREVVKG